MIDTEDDNLDLAQDEHDARLADKTPDEIRREVETVARNYLKNDDS
jgi:hypothetical protein